MKKAFLVQSQGCWGRGETLALAAAQCVKAGAGRYDLCTVDLFVHPTEDPKPAILHGGMTVEFTQGSEKIRITKALKLSIACKMEA